MTSETKPNVRGQMLPGLTGAFEDYRYDALGRRVEVRTRMDSVCEGNACVSSLMWVVWDGSQIAAEIRGPGGDGLSPDSLEAGKGDAAMYGTAEYVNGPTVDEPLEIQGIVVYRTWRGLIDGGECLTGTCGSTGTIDYPGLTYEAYLDAIPSSQSAPVSWHGSLFAEGLDDAGLMYRRNRYYDPFTEQITQEDPLGLGGGMNAYGFGSGDPISFSDPFGLCTDIKDPRCTIGQQMHDYIDAKLHKISSDIGAAGYKVEQTMLHPWKALQSTAVAGGSATFGNYSPGARLHQGEASFDHSIALHVPNLGASLDLGLEGSVPADALATFSGDAGTSKHSGLSLEMYVGRDGEVHPYGLVVHIGGSVLPDPAGLTVDLPKPR